MKMVNIGMLVLQKQTLPFLALGHNMCVPWSTQGVNKTTQESGTSFATAMINQHLNMLCFGS